MLKGMTMATENENPDSDTPADDKPDAGGKKDPHLERAIRERDAAKAKARERETELAEARAKLAEVDAAKETAAAEDERRKSDFAAIEKRMAKEKEAADKRAADAEARLAARERSDNETALVDAVAGKTGVSRTLLKGLFKVAAEQGFDNAPKQVDADVVADAIEKARELEPELFKTRSSGSAGSAGVNKRTKAAGEDPDEDPKRAKARAAAEALSPIKRRTSKE